MRISVVFRIVWTSMKAKKSTLTMIKSFQPRPLQNFFSTSILAKSFWNGLQLFIIRFELARSYPTGSYETIRISSNSFIVTQFSERAQSIIWHPITNTQEGPEIKAVQPLWESSSRGSTGLRQGLILTATLPLELDFIIQGYCTFKITS